MPSTFLGDIELPGDLEWTDEYRWSPVGQQVSRTLTGALVIQASAMQAGRPITLEAKGDNHVWLAKSVIDELRTVLAPPGATLTLTLVDGRTFTVTGRHHEAVPFEAEQVMFMATADTGLRDMLPYTLILRLMQI
jgi:hypothetical protein